MINANGMGDVVCFVKKAEECIEELDRLAFWIAVNLRQSREDEHRLCAFIRTKVSVN